ncbi:uncharacterized protein M6B38_135370 [Iris pallida]|uniref:Uncharacterized protein n=1 Tax=Iris pallida TaxID=29817 RepID=A0AAX6FGI4_IRIPA|nr:uncharacterized protein M6B38_135370 [Iris pallida]
MESRLCMVESWHPRASGADPAPKRWAVETDMSSAREVRGGVDSGAWKSDGRVRRRHWLKTARYRGGGT